jgi:hypothetical protein
MGLVWENGFHGSPAQPAEFAAKLRDNWANWTKPTIGSSDLMKLAKTEAIVSRDVV